MTHREAAARKTAAAQHGNQSMVLVETKLGCAAPAHSSARVLGEVLGNALCANVREIFVL